MFTLKKKSEAANEAANALKQEEETVEKMVVHVMPKKFLNAHMGNNKAQTTGILIMLIGVVLIAAAGFAAYFYFFKTGDSSGLTPVATSTDETTQDQADTEEESASEAGDENPADYSTTPKLAETASSTVYVEAPAASSTAAAAEDGAASASTTEEVLVAGADSDSDGLTDEEEKILGTAAGEQDSDGDGYGDQAELMNLYNPAGAGKLAANPNVKQYFNKTYKYNLIYPYGWSQTNMDGDNSVIFKSDSGHFIQVIVLPNNEKNEIEDWYKAQFWDGSEKYEIVSSGELKIVKSENGLMAYFTDSGRENIYAITYNLGLGKVMEYKSIFEMMAASFAFSTEL